MRTISLASFVLVALAGCATQEPVATSPTAPVVLSSDRTWLASDTKVTCHKEAQTGSSMIHTVCETEQTAADRIATQERLRNMPPNNGIAHPAAGGL